MCMQDHKDAAFILNVDEPKWPYAATRSTVSSQRHDITNVKNRKRGPPAVTKEEYKQATCLC
jgi:hypothetical protein